MAARAETLSVATYNIENYGPADRMTDAGFRKAYPKPESEKRVLRAVIRALNADLLVLQEMGGQPYLDELRRDLRSEGLDYPQAALAAAADADRHIALLARLPLKDVKIHTDLEFAYFGTKETVKRGLLEATVATPAGDVTIFALHLKSRFTERPDDPADAQRRAGETIAIRDAVLKKFPAPADARFLILGDCNDDKSSKALEHLQQRARSRSPDCCRRRIRAATHGPTPTGGKKPTRASTTSWCRRGCAAPCKAGRQQSSMAPACARPATTGRLS